MKKTLIANILSMIGLLTFLILQFAPTYLILDLILKNGDIISAITIGLVLVVPYVLAFIDFILNFSEMFFTKNLEKYNKNLKLVITVLVFDILIMGYSIYSAIASISEIYNLLIFGCIGLVLLVSIILLILDFVKAKKLNSETDSKIKNDEQIEEKDEFNLRNINKSEEDVNN